MNRKRRDDETFEEYRANLRTEQRELKQKLRGWLTPSPASVNRKTAREMIRNDKNLARQVAEVMSGQRLLRRRLGG